MWNQPGQDFRTGKESKTAIFTFRIAGPYVRYWAFATGQYIHVVVEGISGTFGHILFGQIDKDGAVFDGGAYNAASFNYRPINDDGTVNDGTQNGISGNYAMYPFSSKYPFYAASRIRVQNVDNLVAPSADNFLNVGSDTTVEGSAIGPWLSGRSDLGYNQYHPDSGLVAASANELGGNTMIVRAAIYHWGAQQRTRYIVVIPDHAVCNMQFVAPGDILTFGNDEWMVFPAYRKGTVGYTSSLNAGVAYRLRR